MSLHRSIDGAEPLRPEHEGRVVHEERRTTRSTVVAHGTFACPQCDAPVSLAGKTLKPPDLVDCPFCDHHGRARDYLSLRTPGRPARVTVRITLNRATIA
jgi:uncharacterized paraquat-inducible protein A